MKQQFIPRFEHLRFEIELFWGVAAIECLRGSD
jgi:hypothetical protein